MSSTAELEANGSDDAGWLELVAQASEGRYFTQNQLYTAYARGRVRVTRSIARRGKLGLLMIPVGLGIWLYALAANRGITLVSGIALTLAGVACVGSGVVTRRDPAARDRAIEWLTRWQAREPLERFVARPVLAHAGPEYRPERVEAVIVAERDELVDLLLKNGAHHELSALIIAESGYPDALLAEARRALEARRDLPVILLHDATPTGTRMATRLAASAILPVAGRAPTDAGLFPADVLQLAELAPAIPASHTDQVPLDSLRYRTLVAGIRGVMQGALSLCTAISDDADAAEPA